MDERTMFRDIQPSVLAEVLGFRQRKNVGVQLNELTAFSIPIVVNAPGGSRMSSTARIRLMWALALIAFAFLVVYLVWRMTLYSHQVSVLVSYGGTTDVDSWFLSGLKYASFATGKSEVRQVNDRTFPSILLALRDVESLNLSGTDVTPNGVALASSLSNLKVLSLDSRMLDEQSAAALTKCRNLRALYVFGKGLDLARIQTIVGPHVRIEERFQFDDIFSRK
jgi:hypothetical protein